MNLKGIPEFAVHGTPHRHSEMSTPAGRQETGANFLPFSRVIHQPARAQITPKPLGGTGEVSPGINVWQ